MVVLTEFVSTGHLPPSAAVQTLVVEAHDRFGGNDDGVNSDVYPALAAAPSDRFGICMVATDGATYAAGDAEDEFTIMSVSKPFVFALVCDALGADRARELLGVNGTGLSFNSLEAVERSGDGRTNPMVNPGALATTSLVPGSTAERKWQAIHDCLSRFAGRSLRVDEDVYLSASETNDRNQAIAGVLDRRGRV